MVVIEVDPHFVRKNHLVVIFHRIRNLSQYFLFIGIFQRSWTRDSRAKFQDEPILPLKPIRISRHVGTWSDKTHITF